MNPVRLATCALLLAITASAHADPSSDADPRLATVALARDRLIHVDTSYRAFQMVLFPRGERIVSVLLGDPAAYTVTVAEGGDSLLMRASGPRSISIMNVKTDQRDYAFELVASTAQSVPTVVRLSERGAPDSQDQQAPAADALPAQESRPWSVAGDRLVRPDRVRDDGERTYVEWDGDRAIPATFAAGRAGSEEIVNGYMRLGVFTIDRVFDRLTFRIDDKVAFAQPQRETRRVRQPN